MRKVLIDSNQNVQHISVVVLCKNNEKWLNYVLSEFNLFVQTYETKFSFYFFENQSTDNTPQLLREFLLDHDGLYVNIGNSNIMNQMNRVDRIALIRNLSKDVISTKCGEWSLIIDSDIYFNSDILEKLFRYSPAENRIGMLCAYGIAGKRERETSNLWITNNHYYDTAAFLSDKHSLSTWPYCQFESCRECESIDLNKRMECSSLVNVYSAFGGFALIKNEIMINGSIKWESKSVNNSPLNEHIGFCEQIQIQEKLKISIATEVLVIWDISTLNLG